MFRIFTLSILACAITGKVWALDARRSIGQYALDSWTTRNGLPQNSVRAIAQTTDGYLWLGTQAGLVRFDGVRFTVYNHRNTPELAVDHILTLSASADGSLAVGTVSGLVRFAGGRFHKIPLAGQRFSRTIRAVSEDLSGTVWVGIEPTGLARFDKKQMSPVDTVRMTVRAVHPQKNVGVWVGTDTGLLLLQNERVVRRFDSGKELPGRGVWAISTSQDGSVWIGTRFGGACRLAQEKTTCWNTKDGLTNNTVLAITEDRDGNIWMGTDGGGLNRLSGNSLTAITTADGLPNDIVRCVFEDREGSLWLGTAGGGLARLKDHPFAVLSKREGLPSNMVRSAFEDRDGAIWLGTGSGIVQIEDGLITDLGQAEGLPDAMWPVFRDSQGDVWTGSSDGTLHRFRNGRVADLRARHKWKLAGRVHSIEQDRNGTMWVGSQNGLYQFRGNDLKAQYSERDGLPSANVLSIRQTKDGVLWFGTERGLARLSLSGNIVDADSAQLTGWREVMSLYEDARGRLLIGSRAGTLLILQSGAVISISAEHGLPDGEIYGMIEDDEHLWMTCRTGLFHVRRAEMDEFISGKRRRLEFTAFATDDGVHGASEFNWGVQPLLSRDCRGRLWVPTYGGVVVLDHTKRRRNTQPPPVYIEEVIYNQQHLNAQDRPAAHGNLEVRYTALSLLQPERIKFRYKLEGFDADWVEAQSRRQAYYTRLPAGTYTFRVKASNNDGIWNDTGASRMITIQPYFYETPWFIALCVSGGLASVVFVYRRRVRRLHQNEQILGRRVAERTRELELEVAERKRAEQKAAAANRAKSEFLANMSHELRTPMNGVFGMTELMLTTRVTEEQREYLDMLRSSASGLLTLLNDILDFSKIEAGKLELSATAFELRHEVADAVRTLSVAAQRKGLNLAWIVYRDVPDALVGDTMRLRQILVNLIGNAVKFTEQGEVLVAVRKLAADEESCLLELSVRDTGVGIRKDQVNQIFAPFTQGDSSISRRYGGTGLGLAICNHLAHLFNGRIQVESEPAKGSEFRFSVTLRRDRKSPPSWGAGRRVGIVEEHESTRQGVEELLAYWGFNIDKMPADNELPAGVYALPEKRALALFRRTLAETDATEPARWVLTPISPAELSRVLSKPRSEPVERPFASGTCTRFLRILVAEDNLINQRLMRKLLERSGHRVTIVSDGQQAIDASSTQPFDLIFMDVQMPLVDGLQATRAIRAQECHLSKSRVPIIALTAHAQASDRESCLAAGMDDYVSKPVSIDDINDAISRMTSTAGLGEAEACEPSGLPA